VYNGLHSLDFSFWYDRRPLWDIGMITLCLGGFASSGIGLLLAVKRVRRGVTRTARSLVVVPPASEPRNVASGSTQ
jgi:hypothetical protein